MSNQNTKTKEKKRPHLANITITVKESVKKKFTDYTESIGSNPTVYLRGEILKLIKKLEEEEKSQMLK